MVDGLLPALTEDLMKFLDRLYPHTCISPTETLEMAHRYAGKRELIDELLELWEETVDAERSNKDQGGDGA